MSVNILTKALGGLQDLLIGIGSVSQDRNDVATTINRIELIKTLDDRATLKLLAVDDPNLYYSTSVLLGLVSKNDSLGGHFHHEPTVAQSTADDVDIIVDSSTGPNGVWLRTAETAPAGTTFSEKSWAFDSPAGSVGQFFFGGHYMFGATANDFTTPVVLGVANIAHGAHIMLVTAAGSGSGTQTAIRYTGTSITDEGVRTPGTIVTSLIPPTIAANSLIETPQKWIGQVTIEHISGNVLSCNYGFAKYWDNNNTDFTIKGIDVTFLGGATDTGLDIQLIHHNSTGWTYNAGSRPTFTALESLQGDYVTEYATANNEYGAWKRDNISIEVNGSQLEGVLFCVTTTANKAIELGNIVLRISA